MFRPAVLHFKASETLIALQAVEPAFNRKGGCSEKHINAFRRNQDGSLHAEGEALFKPLLAKLFAIMDCDKTIGSNVQYR